MNYRNGYNGKEGITIDKDIMRIESAKDGVRLVIKDMLDYTEKEAEYYAKTYDITPEVLIEYRNELIKSEINK